MPLPKSTRFPDWSGQPKPPEGDIIGDLEVITIPVIHELGSDLRGGIIEKTRWLPPSVRPIVVKVESRVVAHAVLGGHSPEYFAAVRRRKCRTLCAAMEELTPHSAREDFAVCTYPVLKLVNDLLTTLNDVSEEGNTREILRQLRNTLMNGGWNKYRDPSVRRIAVEILKGLAIAEEVLPQSVNESFDRLYAARMNPVGMPLFPVEKNDETPDGQDQIPG
jgi:hypothetical protein